MFSHKRFSAWIFVAIFKSYNKAVNIVQGNLVLDIVHAYAKKVTWSDNGTHQIIPGYVFLMEPCALNERSFH